MSKLSEKLSGLQINMEEGKTRRVEEMESRIMHIDTKVLGWHEDNNKKFNNIKEQLSAIFKYIEEDKSSKEMLLEQWIQDVRNLEQRVFERFEQEVTARRESERKLFSILEERTSGLRNDLAKESKSRYDSIENLKSCLENDLPKL